VGNRCAAGEDIRTLGVGWMMSSLEWREIRGIRGCLVVHSEYGIGFRSEDGETVRRVASVRG